MFHQWGEGGAANKGEDCDLVLGAAVAEVLGATEHAKMTTVDGNTQPITTAVSRAIKVMELLQDRWNPLRASTH